MKQEIDIDILKKFDKVGPRYTSYPTVPYWEEQNFSLEQWTQTLKKSFDESNQSEGMSLYIHLPFCESLCTFCGCHNKRIKKYRQRRSAYGGNITNNISFCSTF